MEARARTGVPEAVRCTGWPTGGEVPDLWGFAESDGATGAGVMEEPHRFCRGQGKQLVFFEGPRSL